MNLRKTAGRVLYKKDSKGKIRQWNVELFEREDGTTYMGTVSGPVDGGLSRSGKEVSDSSRLKSWDRAYDLMKNSYEKKEREGYMNNVEAAESAGILKKPMTAHVYDPLKPPEPMFSVQPKINGARCLFDFNNRVFFTKTLLKYNLPELEEETNLMSNILGRDIDGEVYIPGLTAPEISGAAKNIDSEHRGKFEYHIYDCVSEDGFEFRVQELRDAFKEYEILYGKPKLLKLVPTFDIKFIQDVVFTFDRMIHQGYEGLMIRLWGSPYEHKRTGNLLKMKPVLDAEFPVVHITYEVRKKNGVQSDAKNLVIFHCKCDAGVFPVVPAWDTERRHQFYLDHKDDDLNTLIESLDPLQVEFREWSRNGFPVHAVGIDFRDINY